MKTPAKRRHARAVSKPVARQTRDSRLRPEPALSAACLAVLRDVVAFTRAQSGTSQPARPSGGRILFVGQSPAGALSAAQTLAKGLQLNLRRIDLSAVVSQYIGETEKNLHRIFAAAEKSGVVLFFDEADALFGKRTGVKDSHDRYANLEVTYLLQGIEEFSGVAILSTNRRSNLDDAFLRRFQFIVPIPPRKAVSRPKPKSSRAQAT